ncbi:MAG: hypothetical protein Q8N98_00110 [bacterium]|nr:hypothetical protein [bacterium]
MNKKRKTILIAIVIITIISAFCLSKIAPKFFPEKISQGNAFLKKVKLPERNELNILGEMTIKNDDEVSSESVTLSEELKKITEETRETVEQKISEEFTKYSGQQIVKTIEKLSPEQVDEIKRQLCRPAK